MPWRAALLALLSGRDRVVRWIGGVALFGLLAYLFTPLSAAGAEGAPAGFGINIRYAVPALLAGLALLPVALYKAAPSAGGAVAGESRRDRTRGWIALGYSCWCWC